MQAQRLIPRREQNAASVETIRDAVAFGNVAGLDDSSPSFCIRPRPQEVSEEEQLTFDQNIMLGNATCASSRARAAAGCSLRLMVRLKPCGPRPDLAGGAARLRSGSCVNFGCTPTKAVIASTPYYPDQPFWRGRYPRNIARALPPSRGMRRQVDVGRNAACDARRRHIREAAESKWQSEQRSSARGRFTKDG